MDFFLCSSNFAFFSDSEFSCSFFSDSSLSEGFFLPCFLRLHTVMFSQCGRNSTRFVVCLVVVVQFTGHFLFSSVGTASSEGAKVETAMLSICCCDLSPVLSSLRRGAKCPPVENNVSRSTLTTMTLVYHTVRLNACRVWRYAAGEGRQATSAVSLM